MAQRGWSINLTKCIGCHSCMVACKAENNTAPRRSPVVLKRGIPVAVNYRWVIVEEGGVYPVPTRLNVTAACNHCADPACQKACPVGAISKRDASTAENDGIVLIDQDKCIGCRQCESACPYGAPVYNEQTKKTEKCTMCVHRVDAWYQLQPACVSTCPTGALKYELAFDLDRSGENAPSDFASTALTTPAVRFET